MCTVILLRRPGHAWPLILAANRDERVDRRWDPPAAHWPERPGVIGGRDRSGGGSWMALGLQGVVAAVLNRPGSLGPAPGRASRGDLPLMAAGAASAAEAASAIAALDAGAWRPFNMVVADREQAFFLRGLGEGRPQPVELPAGVTMVTAHDPNDVASPRTRRHLPKFRDAVAPEPDRNDWSSWEVLLADDSVGAGGIGEALRVPVVQGFGTVCASLLALGAEGERRWRFCPAAPGAAGFRDLPL